VPWSSPVLPSGSTPTPPATSTGWVPESVCNYHVGQSFPFMSF
jgi:hypothetical protein